MAIGYNGLVYEDPQRTVRMTRLDIQQMKQQILSTDSEIVAVTVSVSLSETTADFGLDVFRLRSHVVGVGRRNNMISKGKRDQGSGLGISPRAFTDADLWRSYNEPCGVRISRRD